MTGTARISATPARPGPRRSRTSSSATFQENALPAETTPFDGGSDYDAFLSAGIPGGGLFTGDEKRKTQAQAQTYGGTAGKDLDPCYHEACDTIANTNPELLTGNVRRPGLRHRGLRDGQDRLNAKGPRHRPPF